MLFRPDPKPEKTPKKAKKPLKRTSIKKKFKSSGELAIFREIWSERPHVCQVTGVFLGDEFNISFFSHVVPKSLSNELRLDKRNIWLELPTIHYEWDHGSRNQPKFEQKRKLFEELKREINNPE